MKRVLTIFGTRPEVIKLAPVIAELERRSDRFETRNIASSQHVELLHPFARDFGIRIDEDLDVMRPGQNPSEVAARVLLAFDPLLERERPDLVLVQGDTTTAMAGALAAYHRGFDVGHVEAGLRTGDLQKPFPELRTTSRRCGRKESRKRTSRSPATRSSMRCIRREMPLCGTRLSKSSSRPCRRAD